MRVGLLSSWLSHRGGGIAAALRPLARNLEAQGVSVTVFGLADSTDGMLQDRCGDAAIRTAMPRPPHAFGRAPDLAGLLAGSRLDLVHVHGLWTYSSLAGVRWSSRCQRPRIVSPHGMLDPWALGNAVWKKRLAGWWFENAHLAGAACLHALNEAEARAIRAYGLPNPICVVPNGVDLPGDEPPSPPAWAAATGGRRVLLFLGRLHPKKGLPELVRAWADVQSDSPAIAADWVLVIAGWDQGGHARRLERLAQEHGIARSVRFVGPQFDRDKAATLACADAFVLPSLSEGLPVAVLEAWSYGVPVLMTEACNLPEGIAAGAGLPISADPAGIAAGLRRLFALPDAERRAMGARGRALVRARFCWRRIAQDMKAVYDWVGGFGAPPHTVRFD